MEKCGLTLWQVEQGFSSFFAKFVAYLMYFQSGASMGCKKFQILQKFGKKMKKKPCTTCVKKHISRLSPGKNSISGKNSTQPFLKFF